jgi:hypothetical protein
MLRASYFENFDFSDTAIDNALRTVWAKLLLKGEAQTLDRVVFQISTRYWLCNPASHQHFYNMKSLFLSLKLTTRLDMRNSTWAIRGKNPQMSPRDVFGH